MNAFLNMKFSFYSQSKQFSNYLKQFCVVPIMEYKIGLLYHNVSSVVIDAKSELDIMELGTIFDYGIFPPFIMSHYSQLQHEGSNMQVGHTIVQEVKFPPIKSLSIKVLFAVRISDVIDEKERKGFTYETLEGHVEQGISTFLIEKLKSGKTVFSIETFSKPANFLSVLLAPVVSVPYQKYCTNAALENVKKCFKNET